MKAIVTATKSGTRFFLTPEGTASDRPCRAMEYRDRSDAEFRGAIPARHDPAWQDSWKWQAAYLMADGSIAE